MPFPSPGDLPNPAIEPGSPTLQADSLQTELPGKPTYKTETKTKQNKNQTTRAQPYDLAIPLLDIHPKEMEGNEMVTEKPVLEDWWRLELKQAKLDQP